MNELTTEDQRLLTEFLGHRTTHGPWLIGNKRCICTRCNEPEGTSNPCVGHIDFSDLRVVGRLIERMKERVVVGFNGIYWWCTVGSVTKGSYNTPQLAICHAVLAYLKEQN